MLLEIYAQSQEAIAKLLRRVAMASGDYISW
jgi:hypothetical protein